MNFIVSIEEIRRGDQERRAEQRKGESKLIKAQAAFLTMSMSSTESDDNASSYSGQLLTASSEVMVSAAIFFMVVLVFVFFLYLYAKHYWVPERERGSLFVFAAAVSDSPGLDATILESLPIAIFQSANFKEAGGLECSVCLCELSDGEEVRLLPKCKHGFHLECIDMWFHSHSTCPLCRSPLGALPGQLLIQIQPIQEAAMESSLPPSNVCLFSGTQDVLTSTSKAAAAGNSKGMLVIEIPMRESSTSGFSGGQETMKTPTPSSTQMIRSSVRRLLSRGKRTMSSNFGSPRSGGDHIEEGSIGERRATTPTSSSSS